MHLQEVFREINEPSLALRVLSAPTLEKEGHLAAVPPVANPLLARRRTRSQTWG